MKKAIEKMISTLLVLLVAGNAIAGNWLNYANYTEATCIAVRGNEVWLSDKSGLLMYDKASGLKTFFDKGANSLPSLTVERVRVHPQTMDIWIGTYDNGLAMLHNGSWTHIPFPQTDAMLYEMIIDNNGAVWSATTKGVYKYQNGTFTNYLQALAPWDIDILPNGKILCGDNTPYLFDPATLEVVEIQSTVTAYGFSRVIAENDHHYYFSSDHGELGEYTDTTETDTMHIGYARDMYLNSGGQLLLLDIDNVLHRKSGAYCDVLAFGNNKLTAFTVTANDELWGATTTDNKTLYHNNAQSQTEQIDIRRCGLNDNQVKCTYNTPNGGQLILSGNTIQRFDPATQTFTTIPLTTELSYGIDDILEVNGKLYAGTPFRKLYEYSNGNWQQLGDGVLPDNEVRALAADANGNLWLCGYGYVARYNGNTFNVFNSSNNYHLTQYVRDIYCDNTRNLVWFCTYDGIFKLDNGAITFYNDSTPGIQQYYDAVETIAEDENHNIWFGTVYGALLKYDGTNFSTTLLPDRAGNQFVSSIAFNGATMYISDNLHGVWIYENNQWDSLNMQNSPIADNWVSDLNVDLRGNLWISHYNHGIDVYNKNGVALAVTEPTVVLNALVYPNPTTGKINLQWAGNGMADVTVLNIEGKVIYKHTYTENNIMLNLGNQPAGMYVTEIRNNNTVQRIKVLVQ